VANWKRLCVSDILLPTIIFDLSSLLTGLVRENYSSSRPTAVQEWERWAALVAPQSDSAEEYCDSCGTTPLNIPLKYFLPQSSVFNDGVLKERALCSVSKRQNLGGDRDFLQFKAGEKDTHLPLWMIISVYPRPVRSMVPATSRRSPKNLDWRYSFCGVSCSGDMFRSCLSLIVTNHHDTRCNGLAWMQWRNTGGKNMSTMC